ncbi:MAG: class I SAM-dependent methyltransferase [Candidatus Comchoanobacterales bacterium]
MKQTDVLNLKKCEDWMSTGFGYSLHQQAKMSCQKIIEHYQVQDILQLAGLPLFDFAIPPHCHYIHVEPDLHHLAQGHTVVANINALPFAAETFDCLVISHLFEVISDINIQEYLRVLKPNGLVVIFVLNLKGYCWFRNVFDGDFLPWKQRWHGKKALIDFMRQQSCHFIDINYLASHPVGPSMIPAWLRYVYRYLPQLSSLSQLTFVKRVKGQIPVELVRGAI